MAAGLVWGWDFAQCTGQVSGRGPSREGGCLLVLGKGFRAFVYEITGNDTDVLVTVPYVTDLQTL